MSNDPTIILIGPMGVGKSTVGKLLAERLSLPNYPMDDLRWDYYNEIGYDTERAGTIYETEGGKALLRYWKPFEAYAVERLLTEYSGCVIDFGAGHSVYEDEALFERVANVLRPLPYVILLMPSPDLAESIDTLHQRMRVMLEAEGMKINEEFFQANEHFVTHPSNHRLAKVTIYTKDKTPAQTCEEIISLLDLSEGQAINV